MIEVTMVWEKKSLFFVVFIFYPLLFSCYTFKRIESRVDQVEARAIKNDEYIAKVSSELENIKKVLADIDARLLSVEERLARVSLSKEDMERIQMDISKLSKRIETVESRVSFLEKTAIGRGGAGRAEQEGVKANQPSL
jgi:septal ring factor EnvC (AmiA/AmiB activator)